MKRHCFFGICFFALTALSAVISPQGGFGPRVPRGIYITGSINFGMAQNTAYPGPPPPYPNQPADEVIVAYFTTLLDNPAVSGLAPQIAWNVLNPNDPGPDPFHPAANAYTWNPLDDVFAAVDQWNRRHPDAPPKTVQLLMHPGFNSPGWVLNNIDSSVCGYHSDCTGAGSCDALFMSSPAKPASHECGYTTIFFKTEGAPMAQVPLPLPWNSVYKYDWQRFLAALNDHIQHEPSGSAFVSIAVAGPTASTAEMILPNPQNQDPYTCKSHGDSYLSLDETLVETPPGSNNFVPNCPLTSPEFDVPTAWNLLFANFYGRNPKYRNTDLPFIEEWDAAIDAYGRIFTGVTLVLTTTTDALPSFPDADPSLLIPAPGFVSDCGDDPETNPSGYDPANAMQCAAVTQVLTHFTNPFVGGFNAKAVQESGMTAARDSIDLGTNGIKWLAAMTASGLAPLPGTPFRMSRILGGLQFSHSFSDSTSLLAEGCPDNRPSSPTSPCNGLTPGEGLQNVLSISFFPGTPVAPDFCPYTTDSGAFGCGTRNVNDSSAGGNFNYSDAPMNFLQIYDDDFLYASGLSNCSTLQITGRPASPGVASKPPDVSACEAFPTDVVTTQTELNLAMKKLLSIGEWVRF